MAVCPSFSTYSSATMADIAARVVEELRNEPHPDTVNLNLFHWPNPNPQIASSVLQSPKTEHPQEDEFEFAFVTNGSPISADQIFSNGLINPAYPLFNTDLLNGAVKINGEGSNSKPKKTGRTPLRKLMMTEERETTPSCSSSEADDLDRVAPGTYCPWGPNRLRDGASGRRCRKSGSSMRWRLGDLFRRSNSDGNDGLVKISGAGKMGASAAQFEKNRTVKEEDGDGDAAARGFAKRKTVKDVGGKRRTYFPYRQELVGLLSNFNGLGRNLRPF